MADMRNYGLPSDILITQTRAGSMAVLEVSRRQCPGTGTVQAVCPATGALTLHDQL